MIHNGRPKNRILWMRVNMGTPDRQKDVSSAEITAIYRSAIPELSHDVFSEKLASIEGRERAAAFIEKYHYPLVNRKISLSAGYCFLEATRLLSSGEYDSCISFASGFSLLLYNIALKSTAQKGIQYFDTDLPHMITERHERLEQIKHLLDQKILANIQTKALDIEKAYQENCSIREIFPGCDRPVFIAEGITFFLSPGCVNWLIDQLGSYEQSAIIMNYWPDNMLEISALFARVFKDLNQGMILEPLKSFWGQETIDKVKGRFPYVSDWALSDLDGILSLACTPALEPQLTDPNEYFPLRLITGEKKKIASTGKFLYEVN